MCLHYVHSNVSTLLQLNQVDATRASIDYLMALSDQPNESIIPHTFQAATFDPLFLVSSGLTPMNGSVF